MPYPFPARYDGVCAAGCDSRIHPGDSVQFIEDQLVHIECTARLLAQPEPEPEPRPTCPKCFTEIALNGACLC